MRRPRLRNSMATKVMCLAAINAGCILALALITMGFAYRRSFTEFLEAPVRDRIVSSSRKITLDLLENENETWDAILSREAQGTPFQFALLDSKGEQVAGPKMQLPSDVVAFANNDITQKLSYMPKFQLNERPDRQNTAGWLFLRRDPRTKMYWAGVHVLIHFMDNDMYGHGTLIWRFSSLWTNSYFFNFWPYLALIGGSFILTAICWVPPARALLKRVSQLTQATHEIAKGNFDVALPQAQGKDEVAQLTDSVAIMSRQLAGLMRQQERFVSDAAHELCSPISRLQISLELLQDNATSTFFDEKRTYSGQDYLRDVTEEVEQMSEIVQDLLFFSRGRNQKTHICKQNLDVGSVVRSVANRESLSEQEVEIRVPSSLCVYASEPHLRRALANLIRNAHQHAGESGRVEIVAHEENNAIHVLVRDQGPGIPESELELVFKPFYRVELARSRKTGGTGLGLAIVQSSIEACGGSVLCRNRHPAGLEVEMTLLRAS